MEKIAMFLLVNCVCAVFSLPLENLDLNNEVSPVVRDWQPLHPKPHSVARRRRFVEPAFSLGTPGAAILANIRAKRSDDDCEKLKLCKLHARSGRNFFAAFELYFVSKENARLWDHRARSEADCEQRYGDCYYR